MKKLIHNTATLFIGITGLIGGLVWGYYSNWDFEPIILSVLSTLEIIAYITLSKNNKKNSKSSNNQNIKIKINNGFDSSQHDKLGFASSESLVDSKKDNCHILFIDDQHSDFKMVSILKKAGWINTKAVKDITDLDDYKVKEATIIFVDINGVGTQLFEDQGLGLAAALKDKYPKKTIILYSAEPSGNRFNKKLRKVDDSLPKNAEPYEFISLIEQYSKN